MKNKKRTILAMFTMGIAFLLSSGCAEMQKQWVENTCHYEGSYAEGVNDARKEAPMNPARLTYQCPQETKAEVQKGYREGYTKQSQSLGQILNKAQGIFTKRKSCQARDNKIHSGFCANNKSETMCDVHSHLCYWR